MKIDITEEKENPLLKRKEIKFKVTYEGTTPSVLDVKAELVKKKKLDKDLTIVDNVNSEYGNQAASGYAKVYSDKEAMKVEIESKIKKNIEPEAPAEEAPAEEAKEEAAPAEEAKE